METQTNYGMKLIIVAKDAKAMVDLDYDCAEPDQLWEYSISKKEFDFLMKSDVINKINDICDSMIDEFEDETVNDLNKISAAVSYLSKRSDVFDNNIVFVLKDMFEKALKHKTAIYFYF